MKRREVPHEKARQECMVPEESRRSRGSGEEGQGAWKGLREQQQGRAGL